jgi:tRNA acetyltransferase TAN1
LFIYRFILRVLPIEVACYASEDEISRAIAPVVEKYFPVDTQDPQKVPRSINSVDP